jgi:alkanesulfonate monooxygenase SsuD/methylene tetrahydromethanopterin reductase-like flavin-dependent oxidoreductase (luciferase family)
LKIGIYATGSATSSHQNLIDQMQYADEAGFDSIWLRERHFHPDHQGRNFFSSPFVAASYIAARTKRVRIGIGARILPLDHPIHIAEGAATVDVISNGRLDFGIARIGENELYQNAFGIKAEETRDRFEQSFEVIVKAWTEERFSQEGLYKLSEVSVLPKPIQKPHPPIYLVGISAETLGFGAKRGLPILIAGAQTVSIVKKTQENYYEQLKGMGYERENVVNPVNRFIYVAETNEKAVEETKETIMGFIHRGSSVIRDFLFLPKEEITYDLLFKEVCIFGDSDYCLRRIEEIKNTIDLRNLILTFNYYTIDHKKCFQSMERFTKYVMPHLKEGGDLKD